MNAPVINVWTQFNKYKSAKCGCCQKKLQINDKIVGVSRAQGKFTSVTNYHLECSEPLLQEITKELSTLMNQVIGVSEELETKRLLFSL